MALTTLDLGVYREERRADLPRLELHPPVFDGAGIRFGAVIEPRVWLISSDDEIVVQLQNDRLYVNWRRKGDNYPRFSNHGTRVGLKETALQEFNRFRRFAETRTGQALEVVRLELTKIDVLNNGSDYRDLTDLQLLLPVTQVFSDIALSAPQQLQLVMAEGDGDVSTHVSISMDMTQVRIETRQVFQPANEIGAGFDAANKRLNAVFFGLVKAGQSFGEDCE